MLTPYFSRFSSPNVEFCLMSGRLGTRYQIQAFQLLTRNFLIYVLSCSATREATRAFTFRW